MELEVSQHLGAERHERTPSRTGQRTGYREHQWDTRVGSIELAVPQVRDGGLLPSLLEPRKRAEQVLVAVVQEAYVQGVSTRRVDELVRALGIDGVSKSQVSRLCQLLDEQVERFRTRPLRGNYPLVWTDATFVKVRQAGRVESMAVVMAVGVHGCTSCATRWRSCPRAPQTWWPRASARSSPNRMLPRASSSGGGWPMASGGAFPAWRT
jgi:transposase-like protein